MQEVKNMINTCNQVLSGLTPTEFNTPFSPEEIEFLRKLKRLGETKDSVVNTGEIKIQCLQKQLKSKE